MSALKPQNLNLLIVIVCYKAAELTIGCLRSLSGQIGDVPRAKVAVHENGSGPESVRQLQQAIESEGWSDWVMLSSSHLNRGFAGGNNVVLRQAMAWPAPPRCFLLLNADTIVRDGALKILWETARDHPEAGIVSPRIEWPDGRPQQTCYHDCSPLDEMLRAASTGPLSKLFGSRQIAMPVSDAPVEPEWTSFACVMIRQEVFEQIGLLDPGFFLYFDDADYCRRARRAGWKVLHWPDARVVHLRGRSNPLKSLAAQLRRRPQYWYQSRARYYAKFYGRGGLWAANVLWVIGRSVSVARELVGNKERHVCEREWQDIWTNWWNPMEMPVPEEISV